MKIPLLRLLIIIILEVIVGTASIAQDIPTIEVTGQRYRWYGGVPFFDNSTRGAMRSENVSPPQRSFTQCGYANFLKKNSSVPTFLIGE